MNMSGKRVKIYQISNNVTEDTFIGSTTSALYKRLYRHKYDADKGGKSKLCDLIRAVGKDKFFIELIDEGVFSDTDAVNAREMSWIRERRCTLNECYSETKSLEIHNKFSGGSTRLLLAGVKVATSGQPLSR